MVGSGTIVNVLAIVGGATVGLFLRGGLKERFQNTIMQALGLASIFVGLSGALKGMLIIKDGALDTTGTMIMILSLAAGALLGELLQIEERLEKVGDWCKKKFKIKEKNGSNFVEGFMTSSLMFCVGALAVVGSLEDGLTGNASTLYAKSVIDGTASMVFSSTLGIGVYFSCIPMGIYQGAITVLARYLEPFLSDALIGNMSMVGSVLIFAIGLNMIYDKKIKVGNMLPAILIPAVYEAVSSLFR